MKREKAVAALAVALLHGAALFFVSHSLLQSARSASARPQVAATLSHTQIRVSLEPFATHTSAKPAALAPAIRPAPAISANVAPVALATEARESPAPVSTPEAAVSPASSAAATDTAYLNNPPPPYPAASLRMREEGRVVVAVLISDSGLVKETSVAVSSGFRRLDDAALAAVRGWRFVPAQRSGVPIEVRTNVPVRFELSAD